MSETIHSMPGLRVAVVCIALAFVALFVVNTFVSSPSSEQRAAEYFSEAAIQRGLQFSYERKLLGWCGTGLQLALLTALVCTTWGRRLTDFFDFLTGGRWLLTLLFVGATYLLLSEVLSLPLGLARLDQAKSWNMTDRSTSAWLVDWAKGVGLEAVQGSIAVLGLYGLMHFFPRYWWLLAAAGAALLGVVYAVLMPLLIQPIFNTFTPLNDPWLNACVRTLAKRADVAVDEVLVMNASAQGRHTNAYFVGFGATRRIVIYDTLLRSHSGLNATSAAGTIGLLGPGFAEGPWLAASRILAARTEGDDEMETILAHEMGHWRYQHIVKGIALAAIAGFFGMFLLSRILRWAIGRRPFCLTSQTDPAGLPLVLLLGTLASWLAMPLENGISRHFERQADQTSMELANKPAAFIEAEKRLALDNLSNVAPVPFNEWMFSTHPSAVERIEMAQKWKKEQK